MLDLAIIGGGPAGLTAGLYSTRGGLKKVVLFDMGFLGGQITSSSEIENYPGQKEIVSGMELMSNWPEQSKRFGLIHETKNIEEIKKENNTFKLKASDGTIYESKSVLIATGSVPKKAGFKGEKEFFGRGISTCATCDGFFYKGKEVAVIGGGDSALEEAIYLAKLCKKVYLIHRRDTYKAAPSTIEHMKKTENIEEISNVLIEEVYGDKSGVTGIILKEKETNKKINLSIPGIFVFVGRDVINYPLKQDNGTFLCNMNEFGEVIVDLKMRTNIAGLYASGDIRIDASKQVVCAAGDGATAAINIIEYLNGEIK